MNSSNKEESDISEELRQLGANLSGTLRSAWESEERKKVQREIEAGLKDLGEELRKSADEFDAGIGQEVRSGVKDASEKLQSGEVGDRVRSELMTILHSINAQLREAQARWVPTEGAGDSENEVEDA